MAAGEKSASRRIAVLIEEGAVAGYLIDRLKDSFNRGAKVTTINSRDIKEKNVLRQTDILFIPGVRRASAAYRKNIGVDGGMKIKEWVREGGVIAGICQGAYLLTKTFQYADKFSGRVRIIHPSTGIFEGIAYGPIPQYTHPTNTENPFIDLAIARLEFNDAARAVSCYDHGPWLKLSAKADPAEYKVIARFADVPDAPIAIAARRYGKGKAIFSGVVPEIGGVEMARMDERLLPGNSKASEHLRTGIFFARKLAALEEERKYTWNRLVGELSPG